MEGISSCFDENFFFNVADIILDNISTERWDTSIIYYSVLFQNVLQKDYHEKDLEKKNKKQP